MNSVDSIDIIERGKKLVLEGDFFNLSNLAKEMFESKTSDFYSSYFYIVSLLKFDFVNNDKLPRYILNKNEIEDDIKSRIYHAARNKYYSISDTSFENLSQYYPDVAGNKRNTWHKARTKYDDNKDQINCMFKTIKNECDPYIIKMKETAEGEEENLIINKLTFFINYISFAQFELNRYNTDANTFVKNDYDKTPNPGNKPKFIMFLTLIILSFFLFSISMSLILFISIKGYYIFNESLEIRIVATILTSFFLIVMSLYFIIKSDLFSMRKPIIPTAISLLTFLLVLSGILTLFSNELFLEIWYSIVGAIISLISFVYCLVMMIKNKPSNTYNCGTYIGNYKALINNSFKVDFPFKWNKFVNK